MKSHLAFGSIWLLAATGFLLLTLGACSPENASIHARRDIVQEFTPIDRPVIPPDQLLPPNETVIPTFEPDPIVWITQDGGQRQFDFNPQIDILFVIDDSESMRAAQDNLSRNINRFVEGFSRNRMVDFQIGVISVWDTSERYLTQKKNSYTAGELRHVKDAQGRTTNSRFITRTQGFESALARSLKIGIVPYADGGPEIEEIMLPLSESLKKGGRGDVNEGFFREDSHLVVVIVTDADDSKSAMAPERMAEQLLEFKQGRRDLVSAYGVLVRKSDPDSIKDWDLRVHPRYHPECFDNITTTNSRGQVRTEQRNNGLCREGFGPERLEQLLFTVNSHRGAPDFISRNHILPLNQPNFGSDLAKIGSDITIRALEKEIFLDQRPRLGADGQIMVRVRYGSKAELAGGGGRLIPQQARGGWVYDPERNSVRLSGETQYETISDASFAVDLVPVKIAPTQ